MMGELIIYYCEVIGGIYDDRFLVKSVSVAKSYMPNAAYDRPYPEGKEMLLVDELDDKDFLKELIEVMCDELPAVKIKKK